MTDGVITKYYFAGGQRIAMRSNGTLNYLIGDHLGSTSLVTDSSGNVLSQQKYKAWGEERYSSGTKQTSYGYTGQDSYESDFGLLFYNARFYDPYLNHFTQPDSIVPDPSNSQDWDRYAYARNNPVRYSDPSGHIIERAINDFDADFTGSQLFGLHFENGGKDWTSDEMQTVLKGVMDVGETLAEASGCHCSGSEAFKGVYGNTFTFTRSSEEPGYAGYTHAYNHITIYDVEGSPNYLATHPRLVVHELGHAFNVANGRSPENSLTSGFLRDADGVHVDQSGRYYGFNGGYDSWQFGSANSQSEVFADMFVGWVYDKWDFQYRPDLAALRQNHMNLYMGSWINGSVSHP